MGGVSAFHEDEHRERFLDVVGQRVESGDLIVHAFCLMGLASPDRIEEAGKARFGDPRVKGRARNILATLLVSRTGLRPSEVARRLGVSRSAITKSVLRVDETMRSDASVARKVRDITAGLLKEPRGQT